MGLRSLANTSERNRFDFKPFIGDVRTDDMAPANVTCGDQCKLHPAAFLLLTCCESESQLTDLVPLVLSGPSPDHIFKYIIGALSFTTLVFMLMGAVCLRK